jgi:hypothetical protein
MAVSPAHADQIGNLTEVYGVCFRTYWILKSDFVAQRNLQFRDLASADVQSAWYADCDARNALKNVVSWLARTYKLFFINKSKLSGNKWVEHDYTDELLTAAKTQMRVLVQKMIAEYSKFDDQISVVETQFIDSLSDGRLAHRGPGGGVWAFSGQVYEQWMSALHRMAKVICLLPHS